MIFTLESLLAELEVQCEPVEDEVAEEVVEIEDLQQKQNNVGRKKVDVDPQGTISSAYCVRTVEADEEMVQKIEELGGNCDGLI